MPLLSANQTLIDDFLRVIEPFETAHVHPTFSYIAIKQHVSTGASSIVTTRSSNDVKADMEAAERLGVVVIIREALQDLLDRSLIQPNADQMYTQAEQAVTTALARYQS